MIDKICLLRSVITSFSLFYLSFFKISVLVMKTIKKIQRQFLWGWETYVRKIAWIPWENVCKSKGERWLGVIDIRLFNIALLEKWVWCLETVNDGLLKEIIESKYEG